MAATRAFQIGLRRAGMASPSTFSSTSLRLVQRRFAATGSSTSADAILAKQRLARPVSPHLTIFKPNIAMYGSAFNRITGCILSGGLYLYGLAYLIGAPLGWHVETPSLVAAVATWPIWAKVITKFSLAFPFMFHCLNGLRHLSWDLGKGFKNATVSKSGWIVVAASAVGSAALTMI